MSNNNTIPDFDINGNLPPGIHRTTLENIKEKLTWSTKRKKLFDGLEKAVKNLYSAGVSQIYINGSFTTTKDNPSDVDGCWVANSRVNADVLDPVFCDRISSRAKMKERYGVDFLIAGVDAGRVSTQPIEEYFQFDENWKPKGILLLEF